jgi:hypothetical protein
MTLDGSSAPWNRVISNLDKVFAMRLYPKEGIQRNTTDGVYFINRERNGIAYYARFGNNDGQQPDTYVEVSNGSFAWWENGGEGTLLSFSFWHQMTMNFQHAFTNQSIHSHFW